MKRSEKRYKVVAITIPVELLAEIDFQAGKGYRSEFITDILSRAVRTLTPAERMNLLTARLNALKGR